MRVIRRGAARACAVACLLAAGVGGCGLIGGGMRPETPQEQALRLEREGRISRELLARLAAEPAVDASSIRPVIVGEQIRLHGTVEGFGAWKCVMANAELVPGVDLVVDFLVMRPGPSFVTCRAPRVFVWDDPSASADAAPSAPDR